MTLVQKVVQNLDSMETVWEVLIKVGKNHFSEYQNLYTLIFYGIYSTIIQFLKRSNLLKS
jgi:hypothetical protein